MTEQEKIDKRKGFRGKNCYRAACDNGEAWCYSEFTKKYYCAKCAQLINRAARDYHGGCAVHYE